MIGERDLVRRLLSNLDDGPEGVEVGPGDDAAVVRIGDRRLVLTTDSQREGVHYRTRWLTPRELGARAWAVAASDIAAMGADPRWSLAALATSGPGAAHWCESVTEGLAAAAGAAGAPLVGGDVSEAERSEVVVTVIGELPAGRSPLRRTTARPGHDCWILGRLGWAAAGRDLLERGDGGDGPDLPLFVDAYRRPRPAFALAAVLAEEGLVTAAMDVSDGLALDLQRMCAASGCSARIERSALLDPELEALARRRGLAWLDWCVGGGDDYALLCAAETDRRSALTSAAEREGVVATRVGVFVAGSRAPALVADGEEFELDGGWDPFRKESG